MLVIDLRADANIRPYNLQCNQSDVQLHMLAQVLFVGVQHGLDDVAQELGDLLGAAARKGFGGELGLDFLAGQACLTTAAAATACSRRRSCSS